MILDNLTKQEKNKFYDSLIQFKLTPFLGSLSLWYLNGAIEQTQFYHQYPDLSDKILNGSMAATLAGGSVVAVYLSLVALNQGATVGKYLKKALF